MAKRTFGFRRSNNPFERKIYRAWCLMKSRCDNKKGKDYWYYGNRGISFCKKWEQFENFFADMGFPPTLDHTLDRRDNARGYSPENCRWATRKEQCDNTRRNRLISHNGKIMNIAQWAEHLGMKDITLRMRFHRGWPIERALHAPGGVPSP